MDFNMNDIQNRIGNLPAKIEDLQKYILVGRQVLKAHVAKLKAIQAIEDGQIAHQAALEDTQDMAEILLYAEAKLGALIASGVCVNVGLAMLPVTLPVTAPTKPFVEITGPVNVVLAILVPFA